MKLTALSFANAAALSGAILWTACALIATLLPDVYKTGTDLLAFGNIGHFNLGLTPAIFGGILFTVVAWVCGYVFGWSLEKVTKK